MPLDGVFSTDGVTTVGGVVEAVVCAGTDGDCPRPAVGGRLPFRDGVLSTDGVTTVGGVAGVTVCAEVLVDCPRPTLGGRLLFRDGVFSAEGVTTVGGVAGVTVFAGEDICPRFPLCPSDSLFEAVLGPSFSDVWPFDRPIAGGFAGACVESATVGLPGGACRTCDRPDGAFDGRKFSISFAANGWPGCAASLACCRSKDTGGAGGGVFATTGRLTTSDLGCETCLPSEAVGPRTLDRLGATSALR